LFYFGKGSFVQNDGLLQIGRFTKILTVYVRIILQSICWRMS